MSGNDPLVMCVSDSNREISNMINKSLDEGGMRESSLVLKTSKPNLMPEKVRHINFALGVLVQVRHDVNTVATARALITHLGIDGVDKTLKDDKVR